MCNHQCCVRRRAQNKIMYICDLIMGGHKFGACVTVPEHNPSETYLRQWQPGKRSTPGLNAHLSFTSKSKHCCTIMFTDIIFSPPGIRIARHNNNKCSTRIVSTPPRMVGEGGLHLAYGSRLISLVPSCLLL